MTRAIALSNVETATSSLVYENVGPSSGLSWVSTRNLAVRELRANMAPLSSVDRGADGYFENDGAWNSFAELSSPPSHSTTDASLAYIARVTHRANGPGATVVMWASTPKPGLPHNTDTVIIENARERVQLATYGLGMRITSTDAAGNYVPTGRVYLEHRFDETVNVGGTQGTGGSFRAELKYWARAGLAGAAIVDSTNVKQYTSYMFFAFVVAHGRHDRTQFGLIDLFIGFDVGAKASITFKPPILSSRSITLASVSLNTNFLSGLLSFRTYNMFAAGRYVYQGFDLGIVWGEAGISIKPDIRSEPLFIDTRGGVSYSLLDIGKIVGPGLFGLASHVRDSRTNKWSSDESREKYAQKFKSSVKKMLLVYLVLDGIAFVVAQSVNNQFYVNPYLIAKYTDPKPWWKTKSSCYQAMSGFC